MKPASLLIMGAIGLVAACNGAKKSVPDSPRNEPISLNSPIVEAFNEELSQEYQKLPQMLLVSVDVDDQGNPVSSTGKVRRVAMDATSLQDGEGAQLAFRSGQDFEGVEGEGDLGSSTASWAPHAGVTNFDSYTPTRYSQAVPGYSFNYGLLGKFNSGSQVFYAYQRPPCSPAYCAPNNGVPGGNAVGGYPVYPGESIRSLLSQYNVIPLSNQDFYAGTPEQIALGARLFQDPFLSANNDVSCSSCHIERQGTTARYSIGPIGQVLGGEWRGPLGVRQLLIRNAPGLYNLGHRNFNSMFWDSRVIRSPSHANGYISPAGDMLPSGLETPLAVQSLFPLVTGTEMGCGIRVYGPAQTTDMVAEWGRVMQRILSRPDYRAMFNIAFPGVPAGAHGIQHLGNAIAAFEAHKWRADGSPFDRFLRGDLGALSSRQIAGANYFYGKARCATCHSGSLQTDYLWHSIAIPQWGPGAGDGPFGTDDWGVGRVTKNNTDRFKFRTPSLRNVAITGPWGHNGAYASLREFVVHYRNPVVSHDRWNPWQVILPQGYAPSRDLLGAWNSLPSRAAVVRANEFPGVPLNDQEVDAIVDFLGSLTDPRSIVR